MKPRQYQRDCCNAVHKGWQEFNRVLTVMATGTGKTICSAMLIDKYVEQPRNRILFLAHRDELIRQAQDKIMQYCGRDSAIEKAGETAEGSLYPITIGSVQTLTNKKRHSRFPRDYYTHIVVDECHHAAATSYTTVLDYFSDALVWGITATADRTDKKDLGQVFDSIVYEYDLKDAVNDGYLCDITAQTIPVKLDLSKVRMSGGDFRESDVDEVVTPYLREVAQEIAKVAKDRKILVFLPLIKTSKLMCEMMTEAGFKAVHVDGKSPDRKEILQAFADGQHNVLCNSMLLTEGYDEPSVDCIVCLRPTKSRPLYAQIIGRGTRLCAGKEDLLVLDFLWLSEQHKLCHPASLFASKEEVEDKMTEIMAGGGKHKLSALEEDTAIKVGNDREAALISILDINRNRKGQQINPLEAGVLLHNDEIMDYEPNFKWEKMEITDGQATFLAKCGLDVSGMTRGMASKLIETMIKRREDGMATMQQVLALRRMGVENGNTLSFDEASVKLDGRPITPAQLRLLKRLGCKHGLNKLTSSQASEKIDGLMKVRRRYAK